MKAAARQTGGVLPTKQLDHVIGELLKESTSWLKRRELLSSLPDLLDAQHVSEKLYPSLASAIAVQILDDRSALSRLGCEVLQKTHKRLRHPEMIASVLPCLVKQLANSAFVVSNAAADCLMEILNFTPAPCLFMRLACLYDPSASLKIRSSLLRALILPLRHVTVEPQPMSTTQSFMLDENINIMNQSFISLASVSSGISWRAKVVRTVQRVLAVDASAELRVLAKGALKHLQAAASSTRSPVISATILETPPASPRRALVTSIDVEKILSSGDKAKLTATLKAALRDLRGMLSDKTWAKVLTVALDAHDSEIIAAISGRDDGRKFLAGFQELIQHTFPGIVLTRGV